MGRPRKNQESPITEEVRDFKEQQMETPEADGNKIEPVYNRFSLGWYQNPATGYYHVVEIPFNDQGEVGKMKEISSGDVLGVIKERLAIEIANKYL